MSEQNQFNNNLPPSIEKAGSEVGKINPEKKLVVLLKNNNLSRSMIVEEAGKMGMTIANLSYRILNRVGLKKDFF
ncbi:MAG: hypothetical protein COX30_01705 [Candidatus Moranbacteria bacterium CG23_combo_of_CG06-09_8_20_14_all_39_10]|nr:MAG: hypothetical protein COX30_01705 [Candidatus Moranbacteria bacterium CG23_combo_of_CG06-09_8_20_14_all_39_10]